MNKSTRVPSYLYQLEDILRIRTLILSLFVVPTLGCTALDQINETLEDVNKLPDTIKENPVGDVFQGLTLVSAAPSRTYGQDGVVDFSMLPTAGLSSFSGEALQVQVKNRDGSYSDCEHDGGETIPPEPIHVLSMLIDGSGSMELSYPPPEYGDVCPTCPHDPDRERILASSTLVRLVHNDSPESSIAVGEFGPDPFFDQAFDFEVTSLHHDFSSDTESVVESLQNIRGYEEYGTPMYDSVAEMVGATIDSGYEGKRSVIVLTDGLDNQSTRYELNALIDYAVQYDVTIYTVGLGPASVYGVEANTDGKNIDAILALQDLAVATGGFYAAVEDPQSMDELYGAIAATLTDGYRREKYVCVPSDVEEVPHDQCGCPPSRGEAVVGRIMLNDTASIPWQVLAP